MKTYLVGGAVRDQLLNRPVKERDWVVVGGTIDEMIEQRFKPVGKAFPVFLHPKTGEEYALARTEKKVAKGYQGFEFYTSPNVTLEEDLKRRDLTINAMAETPEGVLVDPYHGQRDLKDKILRHVSEAFIEDPVRILRVARFMAKLGDFQVAPETMDLMREMVANGEVDALVPERVWQEMQKALTEEHSERFIHVLRECGALEVIFPEIDALFGVPNPPKYHPEIDSGVHTLKSLKAAIKLSDDPVVRFAALCHDLGKGSTPKDILPHHYGHEERGAKLVSQLCKRINAPKVYRDLAFLAAKYHTHCHKIFDLRPRTVLKLLQALDPFRQPERFEKFLLASESDGRGCGGREKDPYPQAEQLRKYYEACAAIDVKKLLADMKPNQKIEKVLRDERLRAISKVS